jgi:hypothetical protein
MINVTTNEELKRIFTEILLSRTDAVTKISPGSVLNALAYSNAKLGQKVMANIAVAQSMFLPDETYGQGLDELAEINGISPRFTTLGSSTYVRVNAQPGTVYTSGTHTFSSNNGIVFNLDATFTVGDSGFYYAKVSSVATGSETNINAFTISTVNPIPNGHQLVTNEFMAIGGRDAETDDQFRDRIKTTINVVAMNTISRIENILIKINSKVSRVFHNGTNDEGKIVLSVLTQNGSDLTSPELVTLTNGLIPFLSLNELNPNGLDGIGVVLTNVIYQPIDISFRCVVDPLYDPVEVRKFAQQKMGNYVSEMINKSFKVEWDDLLQLAKDTDGITYVYDNYFFPSQDLLIDFNKVPRVRGFLMLDTDGEIISDGTESLNPSFYPSNPDFIYIGNVLSEIY